MFPRKTLKIYGEEFNTNQTPRWRPTPFLLSCTAYSIYCPYIYSGVLRNFVRGGFNKFSWGQRTKRTGIWGR